MIPGQTALTYTQTEVDVGSRVWPRDVNGGVNADAVNGVETFSGVPLLWPIPAGIGSMLLDAVGGGGTGTTSYGGGGGGRSQRRMPSGYFWSAGQVLIHPANPGASSWAGTISATAASNLVIGHPGSTTGVGGGGGGNTPASNVVFAGGNGAYEFGAGGGSGAGRMQIGNDAIGTTGGAAPSVGVGAGGDGGVDGHPPGGGAGQGAHGADGAVEITYPLPTVWAPLRVWRVTSDVVALRFAEPPNLVVNPIIGLSINGSPLSGGAGSIPTGPNTANYSSTHGHVVTGAYLTITQAANGAITNGLGAFVQSGRYLIESGP